MSRLLPVLLCAIIAIVAPSVANANHSPGTGPHDIDFVVGAGHHSVPDTQFTISVHSGPAGEDPKGHLSFKIGDNPRIHADVVCLIVVNNEAFATGVMMRPASVAGQPVVMHAIDNGTPGDDLAPDLLRFSFTGFITPVPPPNVVLPVPPACLFPVLPPVPVTEGNIVVHDAP